MTDAEIKMFGSQRLSNGKTLREVASVQAVWYRDWWQTSRGTYYVNWSEKHIGRFYFDKGVNIWWGSGGYHRCGYSSGVGYDVTPMSCSVYQAVPRAYDNHDQFRVSVLVNGFPMHTTHWMTARTWSSGSVQFFKST